MKQPCQKQITDIAHETLKTFSLTHNYNKWIINLLSPYIGQKILEIGCGIGNLTFYLQNFGDLHCLDISEFYLAHMKIDFPHIKFHNYDITDEHVSTLQMHKFDTIVCVNVLEHIENDKKGLYNMFQILCPEGRLLIYVPALQFLFGSLDTNLSHYRRYNKQQLIKILTEVGFKIETIFYSNFIGILGWFLNGKIRQKKEIPCWQTILFDKFVPLCAKLESYFHPPIGMSLMVVARKLR